MKINREKVATLGKLARLKFSDSEMENMLKDLKEIIKFVNKLDEIKTDGVSPLTHIQHNKNNSREDVAIIKDYKSFKLALDKISNYEHKNISSHKEISLDSRVKKIIDFIGI